jgi:hypothetical protein
VKNRIFISKPDSKENKDFGDAQEHLSKILKILNFLMKAVFFKILHFCGLCLPLFAYFRHFKI